MTIKMRTSRSLSYKRKLLANSVSNYTDKVVFSMFQNGLLATRKIDGQSLHCNEQKEAGDENHVIG
jgi:hypothetical protein